MYDFTLRILKVLFEVFMNFLNRNYTILMVI